MIFLIASFLLRHEQIKINQGSRFCAALPILYCCCVCEQARQKKHVQCDNPSWGLDLVVFNGEIHPQTLVHFGLRQFAFF